MAKRKPVPVQFLPEIAEALRRCARDDRRSVSGMLEKIAADYLKERGYLT